MLKFLKKVTDLLIYGNYFISICAALLLYETYILLALPPSWFYTSIAFFSTLFTYNIDRIVAYKEISKIDAERQVWITKHLWLMSVSVGISLLYLVVCVFYISLPVLVFIGHLGVISVAYSLPLLYGKKNTRTLRSIKGLKIFLIAYVWAASTVMMPCLAEGLSIFSKEVVLLFIERFLFIFIITLPFDIRDYKSDIASNVSTIPGMIGIRNAKILAVSCMVIFIIIAILHYPFRTGIFWARIISAISTLYIVYKTEETHHEYYFTGLLDGTMVIQFVLVAGLNAII